MQKAAFFTRDRQFYRSFLTLTFIVAMQNVIVCMVGLVDNIMVGRYSEYALSGVALANQVQFLLQMIVGGVVEGMMVIASQYWGAKSVTPIQKAIAVSLRFAVFTGLAFTFACGLFPERILSLYTNDPQVIEMGAKYMRIVCISYVFFCAGNVFIGAARSTENATIGMISSVSGLSVNVLLNYALIFGRLGFPELGVEGAAIATVIGRLLEFSIAGVYMLKRDKRLNLRLKSLFRLDSAILKDYLRVALPVIFSGASWGIAMSIQTAILALFGNSAISANSIASTIFQVISVFAYGCASAAGVLTGKIVGSGEHKDLKSYVRTMQALFLVIGVLSGAALFSVKDLVLANYNVSDVALELANSFILVLCITVVGTAYQCPCLTGIVRGGGNTKFVFYNDLIFMWGLVLPFSALSAFVWKLSPAVVFIILKSDQIVKCFVAVWQVNSYHWVRPVTRSELTAENILNE